MDASNPPNRHKMSCPTVRATALNEAGRVAWLLGHALYRAGLALCGVAGDLDARADAAGYWTPARVERIGRAA